MTAQDAPPAEEASAEAGCLADELIRLDGVVISVPIGEAFFTAVMVAGMAGDVDLAAPRRRAFERFIDTVFEQIAVYPRLVRSIEDIYRKAGQDTEAPGGDA